MVQKRAAGVFAPAALEILSGTYKKSMFLETLDRCSNQYLRVGGRGLCLGAGKARSQPVLADCPGKNAPKPRRIPHCLP